MMISSPLAAFLSSRERWVFAWWMLTWLITGLSPVRSRRVVKRLSYYRRGTQYLRRALNELMRKRFVSPFLSQAYLAEWADSLRREIKDL